MFSHKLNVRHVNHLRNLAVQIKVIHEPMLHRLGLLWIYCYNCWLRRLGLE